MKPKRNLGLKLLAERVRVDLVFLEECLEVGALRLRELPGPSELARLRRLQRVCRALDLDAYAGGIIVDLLERLGELERELDRLRAADRGP